ncbi:MAG: hypothetical protein IIC78_05390 [Chloroflexi bacterium]|nr:hypothetical protein [Chloroflexota bacterium]
MSEKETGSSTNPIPWLIGGIVGVGFCGFCAFCSMIGIVFLALFFPVY